MSEDNTLGVVGTSEDQRASLNDPSKLVDDSTKVIDASIEFDAEVKKIYDTIDDLKRTWKGDSATNFYEAMEKFKEEFETYGPACQVIGETLKEVGEDYVKLEHMM